MKILTKSSALAVFALNVGFAVTINTQPSYANEVQFLCRFPGTDLGETTTTAPTLTVNAPDINETPLVVWETEYFNNQSHPNPSVSTYSPMIRCQEAVLTFTAFYNCGLLDREAIVASVREHNSRFYPVLETTKQPDWSQCYFPEQTVSGHLEKCKLYSSDQSSRGIFEKS